MKTIVCIMMAGWLMGCSYSHVASTRATFTQSNEGLVLRLDRHVEEILHGPDSEEEQTLMLRLKDFKIGERLTVPSEKAGIWFDVDRSGPRSHGTDFRGFVTVKNVTGPKVLAHVDVAVTAVTTDGRYTQQAEFDGDFTFLRQKSEGL